MISFKEKEYVHMLNKKKVELGNVRHPIIYHDRYNISAGGIEKFHPFDSQKYGRIFRFLKDKGLMNEGSVHKPSDPSRYILLEVMLV